MILRQNLDVILPELQEILDDCRKPVPFAEILSNLEETLRYVSSTMCNPLARSAGSFSSSHLRRSRKALQNEYLVANIGVDTVENEPPKNHESL